MNPKTFLTKTTSVLGSVVLALGGSLIATEPANASVVTNDPALTGNAYPGGSLDFDTPITFDVAPGSNPVEYVLLICDSARNTGSNHGELIWTTTNFNGMAGTNCNPFANGSTIVIYNSLPITLPTGMQASNIQSGKRLAIGVKTDVNAGVNSHNFISKTLSSTWSTMAPATITGTPSVSITSGTITATLATSSGSINTNWYACSSAVTPAVNSSTGNFSIAGCTKLYQSQGMSYGQILTNSFPLSTSIFELGGQGYASFSISGKHLLFVQFISGGSGGYAYSASVEYTGSGSSNNNQQQTTAQVTREVTRSIPIPAFQAPILNSLAPKMTGGFSSNGGRLVLKDVKPADITSVMLNGKKVEVVASKSGAALRIPAGAGAGDLQFTMADGTVINVANAVKITQSQVDPKLVDLNPLPTFKAGSVVVPAAIKSALNKRKAIILDSDIAKCVGYASSNTASARAIALTRAANVCGVITDINENIEPIVKVVVSKTIAKKTPVKYQTW